MSAALIMASGPAFSLIYSSIKNKKGIDMNEEPQRTKEQAAIDAETFKLKLEAQQASRMNELMWDGVEGAASGPLIDEEIVEPVILTRKDSIQ